MAQYIALLRGINLGKHHKMLMTDLRSSFEKSGYTEVKSYIQTGNVLFNCEKEEQAVLSKKIQEQIFIDFGFEVPVLVRKAKDMNTLIEDNPFLSFEDAKPEHLHITFLKDRPKSDLLDKIKSFDSFPDQFQIRGKVVFIYCPRPYRETKLGNQFFEKQLKVKASTRTWKTILKLSEMIN